MSVTDVVREAVITWEPGSPLTDRAIFEDVSTVIGKERKASTGRTRAFTSPSAMAANARAFQERTCTPGTKWALNAMPAAMTTRWSRRRFTVSPSACHRTRA